MQQRQPRRFVSIGVVLIALLAHEARAQSHYRNIDAGRPLRVEDAEPAARYEIDLDAAPFQVERLNGGTLRYRAEPKIGYGILPLTEIDVRVPLVQVNPPASTNLRPAAGIAGVSLGVMHQFALESTLFPALAMSAEVSLPAGNLSARTGSYFVKGIATRTTRIGRLHLNAGAGTYVVRPSTPFASACAANDSTCAIQFPIIIFDAPCDVRPAGPAISASASRYCMAQQRAETTTTAVRTRGTHWLAGAGYDHSFALSSTLIGADVFAERFVELYPTVDWSAEAGIRHQLTPVVVVHAGFGRHFAGVVRSTYVTAGAAFSLATPPWGAR